MQEDQQVFEQEPEQNEAVDKVKHISRQNAATTGYKCPSCGAPMKFDPAKQGLTCEYCGTSQAVVFDDDVAERSFDELFSTDPWTGEIKTIRCDNCGAVQVLDEHEIATVCPFCGSASVLETHEVQGIKPDTAIPFKINKETATQRCLKWLKSRVFAPSKFKKEAKLNEVRGCYVPVWTFDCDTVADYYGQLGEHYTETYYVDGKQHTVTKTRYFFVSGTMDNFFDDIYVKGSTAVNESYLKKIQPFPAEEYVKYDDKMLAGYSANHYDIDPLVAWQTAEQQVQRYFENAIVARYNADEVVFLDVRLTHRNRSFKYLMVPLYISVEQYKDKTYSQYVNGVHGKTHGSAPISPVKVGLTALGVAAVIAGIILLITLL